MAIENWSLRPSNQWIQSREQASCLKPTSSTIKKSIRTFKAERKISRGPAFFISDRSYSLARTFSYYLALKNCRDDLHIEMGHQRSSKHLTPGKCVGRNKKPPEFFQGPDEG
jgi:hypothetical protein